MPLVDNPNQTLYCDADRCGDCGGDLTGAPVARVERRQVLNDALVEDVAAGSRH
jgi:hypothetical protein